MIGLFLASVLFRAFSSEAAPLSHLWCSYLGLPLFDRNTTLMVSMWVKWLQFRILCELHWSPYLASRALLIWLGRSLVILFHLSSPRWSDFHSYPINFGSVVSLLLHMRRCKLIRFSNTSSLEFLQFQLKSLCRLSGVRTIAGIGRKAFARLSQGADFFLCELFLDHNIKTTEMGNDMDHLMDSCGLKSALPTALYLSKLLSLPKACIPSLTCKIQVNNPC